MKKINLIFALLLSFSIIGQNLKFIGKPIEIGGLEIAQHDFPKEMDWNEAKKACADIGEGWRLPTKEELNTFYYNKEKIGGFAGGSYWSSSENDSHTAWLFYFFNGTAYSTSKYSARFVRAVRDF
jgi:hypothetical protein